MNNIVAIVVTYNRKELLKKNIEALLCQNTSNFDIYIIDNASTDGTKEYISDYIAANKVQYLNTGKNLGGAGGFNFGINEACKAGYDYIWIMDDDTIPFKDCLNELMSADKVLDGNYGFLSSVALWKDNTPCKMNRQKSINNWYDDAQYLKFSLLRIFHATFVSFFVKRETVEKYGLPIKEFFIWGDDVEYSNRLSKAYPCYVVGSSQVLHDTANNEGSNIAKDDIGRVNRYKFAYRNEMYIAKKNGIKGLCRQFAKICLHILRVLVSEKGYRFKKWGIIIGSSVRGLFFNPSVEFVGGKNEK